MDDVKYIPFGSDVEYKPFGTKSEGPSSWLPKEYESSMSNPCPITTGHNNVAMGYDAMADLDGPKNVFIGIGSIRKSKLDQKGRNDNRI